MKTICRRIYHKIFYYEWHLLVEGHGYCLLKNWRMLFKIQIWCEERVSATRINWNVWWKLWNILFCYQQLIEIVIMSIYWLSLLFGMLSLAWRLIRKFHNKWRLWMLQCRQIHFVVDFVRQNARIGSKTQIQEKKWDYLPRNSYNR